MKKLFVFLCAAILCLPAVASSKSKANKDMNQFRYEIECAGGANAGTYLVRVYSYSKKANIAEEQCRKNAVHGVIFKGTPKNGTACSAKSALVRTPGTEEMYKDYFDKFFATGGEFQRYSNVIAGTTEVTKVGKEYKVGVTVSIQIDALRKALESAGVIKGLGSGF